MTKRYAIKFPDGTYSNGPPGKHVPFEKAKTWSHMGHIKNHLQHDRRYPSGTKVVEVVITHTETDVTTVAEVIAQNKQKAEENRAKHRIAQAQREVQRAKQQLEEARRVLDKHGQ